MYLFPNFMVQHHTFQAVYILYFCFIVINILQITHGECGIVTRYWRTLSLITISCMQHKRLMMCHTQLMIYRSLSYRPSWSTNFRYGEILFSLWFHVEFIMDHHRLWVYDTTLGSANYSPTDWRAASITELTTSSSVYFRYAWPSPTFCDLLTDLLPLTTYIWVMHDCFCLFGTSQFSLSSYWCFS